MREQKFEDYFGRKIAIDASMHIYQFLVSLQSPLLGTTPLRRCWVWKRMGCTWCVVAGRKCSC